MPSDKVIMGKPKKPDLDNKEAIDEMVRLFYQRLLADEVLRPLFVEVAGIDVETHLPVISSYWQKMLLGDRTYQRHMMAKHRALHRRSALRGHHHERWLAHFIAVQEACFEGPKSDQAKRIAINVINNLYQQVSRLPGAEQSSNSDRVS